MLCVYIMATASFLQVSFQTTEKFDFENWMSKLPKSLRKIPINELAIPGSHDSTTSYSIETSDISPDLDSNIAALLQFNSALKPTFFKWQKTQDLQLTDQLTRGIRYFDLRTAYKSSENKFYFVHGLYNANVMDAMNEVKAFLDSHPREIVILDFNHFYDMTSVLHTRLTNELSAIFGSKMCPKTTQVSTLTLSYLWGQKQQLIVFYHDTSISNLKFWNKDMISDSFPDKPTVSEVMTFLEDQYNKGRSPGGFHITQGISTPTATTIQQGAASSLKDAMARPLSKTFVDWLKKKMVGPTTANIFSVDFVEFADFIPSAISLNHKQIPSILDNLEALLGAFP